MTAIRTLVLNGADCGRWGEPAPRGLPYGAEELESLGFDLASDRPRGDGRRLRRAVEHRLGVRLDAPSVLLYPRAELVVAYLEPNIGYPALCRRARLPRISGTPLAAIVCWAAQDLVEGDAEKRRRTIRMVKACDLLGYWSSNQTAVFLDAGIPEDRLAPLTFGVDVEPFLQEVPGPRDIDVLAVGQDRGRDYDTLVDAVAGTGIDTHVVAPASGGSRFGSVREIQWHGVVPQPEYRRLLARAKVVVVPTRELAYPTGQTVALEAAAAGCAVVVTDTAAMSEYFRDDETALMPPPGDARALRECIRLLLADDALRDRIAAAGRQKVVSSHTSDRMWHQLAPRLASLVR